MNPNIGPFEFEINYCLDMIEAQKDDLKEYRAASRRYPDRAPQYKDIASLSSQIITRFEKELEYYRHMHFEWVKKTNIKKTDFMDFFEKWKQGLEEYKCSDMK